VTDQRLDTAVAILIFDRPETTAMVFEAIRNARPRRLLVVADGPRPDQAGEAERCAAARAIVERVDWECELSTNYSEINLGCGLRVSSGLDWVFGTVPEAIVLEDDCVPNPSFFTFCGEILDRYRNDDRVMHVSGDNFQSVGRSRGLRSATRRLLRGRAKPSYYFSRYPHVWGWASWRRAWASYDVEMTAWRSGADRKTMLENFTDPAERNFWRRTWDAVARGEVDTWDYQWAFACLMRGGLSVMPATNLVSNIGFGDASTHTGTGSALANLPANRGVGFPLRHPSSVSVDGGADRHTARLFFGAER
jgi:hypothetical protein